MCIVHYEVEKSTGEEGVNENSLTMMVDAIWLMPPLYHPHTLPPAWCIYPLTFVNMATKTVMFYMLINVTLYIKKNLTGNNFQKLVVALRSDFLRHNM